MSGGPVSVSNNVDGILVRSTINCDTNERGVTDFTQVLPNDSNAANGVKLDSLLGSLGDAYVTTS